MTVVLFIQRENSVHNRRGPPPDAPLLLFGGADVLAKASGPSRLGLVPRKILEKNGWWVTHWLRPAPKSAAAEAPPGSKAWLDQLNAGYGPIARPVANKIVQILRAPRGRLSQATYNQGVEELQTALSNRRIPYADHLHLLALWVPLFSRGQVEKLAPVELAPPQREAAGLAAGWNSEAAAVVGSAMMGAEEAPALIGVLGRGRGAEPAIPRNRIDGGPRALPVRPLVGEGPTVRSTAPAARNSVQGSEALSGVKLAQKLGAEGELAVGISGRKEKIEIPGTSRSRVLIDS